MAAADAALLQRLVRQGYGCVTPLRGLAVLASAMGGKASVTAASPFDFGAFLAGARQLMDCCMCSMLQPSSQESELSESVLLLTESLCRSPKGSGILC